jgi:hypothetical protein
VKYAAAGDSAKELPHSQDDRSLGRKLASMVKSPLRRLQVFQHSLTVLLIPACHQLESP